MSFDFSTLITDRKQSDVSAMNTKGKYTAGDLNRVTACMDYLYGVVQGFGYSIPGYARIKVNRQSSSPNELSASEPESPYTWTENDAPTSSQMNQYLKNVKALKDVLSIAQSAPELPQNMAFLTYSGANNIELVLNYINDILTAMKKIGYNAGLPWVYSGVGYYFGGAV